MESFWLMLKKVYYKPEIKSFRSNDIPFYYNCMRIHNLGNFLV